ncbi:hypothetical protein K3495_g16598, partial [Podosphaera aphanis]
MAVKACNDTAGPNGLIPTLCALGAYPRLTWNDPPSPAAIQKAESLKLAMKELRKYKANQLVDQAANMRNGPNNAHLEEVPIGGLVRVWREGKNKRGEWTGPWVMIDKDQQTVTVRINEENVNFRSTVVSKWYDEISRDENNSNQDFTTPSNESFLPQQTPRETQPTTPQLRRSTRKGRFDGRHQFTSNSSDNLKSQIFLSPQEEEAIRLSADLRARGLITSPGDPFEESTKKEINGLLDQGV